MKIQHAAPLGPANPMKIQHAAALGSPWSFQICFRGLRGLLDAAARSWGLSAAPKSAFAAAQKVYGTLCERPEGKPSNRQSTPEPPNPLSRPQGTARRRGVLLGPHRCAQSRFRGYPETLRNSLRAPRGQTRRSPEHAGALPRARRAAPRRSQVLPSQLAACSPRALRSLQRSQPQKRNSKPSALAIGSAHREHCDRFSEGNPNGETQGRTLMRLVQLTAIAAIASARATPTAKPEAEDSLQREGRARQRQRQPHGKTQRPKP